MTDTTTVPPLDPRKFRDPDLTLDGDRRARVALERLETLWFDTGTLCNITCRHCYIESSPRNDRLAYLTVAEVRGYLDEIARTRLPTREIGFTGGEPFMNRDLLAMLEDALGRGFDVLVLTNAMRPMMRHIRRIERLAARYGRRLVLRVSLDHYDPAVHEMERGPGTWAPALAGLTALAAAGATVAVAGRTAWGETEASLHAGYARLFAAEGIPVDADDPAALVLFPEMDDGRDVPEITERCWGLLGVEARNLMCATSRMVVKRKGAARPAVVACTLIPYDVRFELGESLAAAHRSIPLNHPHCATFCVLGGASCSRA